jgi:hypothetical protein
MAMQDVGAAPRAAQGLRELQPLETNLPLSADAARVSQAGTAEAEAEDPAAPWPQRPFRRGWRFNWPGVGIMVVYCLAFIFYLYIRIRYTLDLGAYVWCGLQRSACASVPVESHVKSGKPASGARLCACAALRCGAVGRRGRRRPAAACRAQAAAGAPGPACGVAA